MNRGDVVTVALSGDYGKPRPALIIQSDLYKNTESVCVLLMSSTAINVRFGRVLVEPAVQNGLRSTSQIMVDKVMTLPRGKVGQHIGRLDSDTMAQVDRAIALFLGIV